jgi:hypothetical protein
MDDDRDPSGGHASGYHDSDLFNLQKLLAEAEPMASLYTAEIIDPIALGFVPTGSWSPQTSSLQVLQDSYFIRKNNVNRRFEHKLWNALRITSAYPNLTKCVGVHWLNDRIIKVYKRVFARLLNISCIDGGLFHKQGNFTRHGFVVVLEAAAKQELASEQILDVDFREVTLISHKDGRFIRDADEETISHCRWENPGGTTRIAALKFDSLLRNDLP